MMKTTLLQQLSATLRSSLILGLFAFGTSLLFNATAADTGFVLRDNAGVALDILQDGRPVARYMYAHDNSSNERRLETYKPYVHVFDADGETFITKGAGGQFTHHRGIFIGWNRLRFNGKRYDRWHMIGGEIVHQNFIEQTADADSATFTSVTHWNDENGDPILVEHRTMTFSSGGKAGRLIIDFSATLMAVRGDVVLEGDPEHAGVQFRPANEVVKKKTVYVFPKTDADPKKDRDYAWVGETYTLGSTQHSVVHMNHPDNPKNTRHSAYRDYGRFGAFFTATIPDGESLTMNYRFLITDGEMPSTQLIQKTWDAFADVPQPSPVPEITVRKQPQ